MNTYADKTPENKRQSVASAVLQMKTGIESAFQLVNNRPEAVTQQKLQEIASNSPNAQRVAQSQTAADNSVVQHQQSIKKKENDTGLPDSLKTGIESLSRISLDDVKVHRNSDKPAQFQARAYAQGTNIYLGVGQDKYLPHEAWHVVQQKQGRVKPTAQMKRSVNINDDRELEKEADMMGAKALKTGQNAFSMSRQNESEIGQTTQTKTLNLSQKKLQNVVQAKWFHAEVTKESGAAVHKYKKSKEGKVSVKSGGWFGGGKLLTVPKGEFVRVNPEKKVDGYVFGAYPVDSGQRTKGYINKNNFKIVHQWKLDAKLAASLFDGYLDTHKVQQHIREEEEFQASTRKGMGGLFAAINKQKDKGVSGFFDNGKIKDPMTDVEHWKEMGESLKAVPVNEEAGLIPMTCDQSTAIIIATLAENSKFISSLIVIKQGDPKQHGHWYVLANRSPEKGPPTYGERLNPGEFIVDIWGSLRLKEDDPNVSTVVHTSGSNAVFNAAVITKDQKAKGKKYVKDKVAEQNRLRVMLNILEKSE